MAVVVHFTDGSAKTFSSADGTFVAGGFLILVQQPPGGALRETLDAFEMDEIVVAETVQAGAVTCQVLGTGRPRRRRGPGVSVTRAAARDSG